MKTGNSYYLLISFCRYIFIVKGREGVGASKLFLVLLWQRGFPEKSE